MLERSRRNGSQCTPRFTMYSYIACLVHTVPITQPTHGLERNTQAHMLTTLLCSLDLLGRMKTEQGVGCPEKRFNLPYLALKAGLLTPPSGHVKKIKLKNGFVGSSNYNVNRW